MKDLSRRLASSAVLISVIILVLLVANMPYLQFITIGTFALIASIAVWEYAQFAKAKKMDVQVPALLCFAFAETVSFFLPFPYLPTIVFLGGTIAFFALHFKKNEGVINDVAASVFSLAYIAVPFGMLLAILFLEQGRLWVIYLLVVTKITDTGAYFVGRLLGRNKLAPSISPNKTIEGGLGGLVFALLASYLFSRFSSLPSFPWILFGLVFSVLGQFGDLVESLLKRDAQKKDSNALPGLGGILDEVDSLLFNIPILYIYLQIIKP